jgi:ribosomal protein S8
MPYYTHAYVVNHVNILLSRKQKCVQIILTKKTLRLVRVLYKNAVIKNYIIVEKTIKNKKIKFIRFSGLFFKNESYFKGIRLVSTPSKKHTISLKGLNLLKKISGTSLIILETSRGIISHIDALKLGVGGLILCVVG